MANAQFFAPGFDEQVEQQNIERQRKMAELLRQQSTEMPQGSMVSGHYVAPSFTQGLAKMLQAYSARSYDDQASEQQKALAEAIRGRRESEWQKLTPMLNGEAARDIQPLTPNDDEGNAMPVVHKDAVAPDPRGAYTLAMQSSDPALRQFGFQGMAQLPQQEQHAKERAEDVAWRQQESEARRTAEVNAAELAHKRHLEVLGVTNANAKEIAQANREHAENLARLQREHAERMARLTASLQPANKQVIQTANGMGTIVNGQFVPLKDASGNVVHGPKDAGTEAAKASQLASFDTMLGTLERLQNHSGLANSVGLRGALPTMPGSKSADFQAELETFKAQAFIPMVAQLKGMGALSDAEGKKLSAAVGALDPKMGEQAFRDSISRIMDDMNAARARVLGVPQTGTANNLSDAAAAELARRQKASKGSGGATSIGGE